PISPTRTHFSTSRWHLPPLLRSLPERPCAIVRKPGSPTYRASPSWASPRFHPHERIFQRPVGIYHHFFALYRSARVRSFANRVRRHIERRHLGLLPDFTHTNAFFNVPLAFTTTSSLFTGAPVCDRSQTGFADISSVAILGFSP